MELNARQRRALEAICDTFAPGGDGLPSASEAGVPDAVLDAIRSNPREAERKQFGQLLALWDRAPLGLLGGGRPRRFSKLDQERRERALLSWCDSRVTQRRAAFQALRKGALLMYYMVPGAGGGPNPAWERIGYPGPVGPPSDPPERPLHPLEPTGDETLTCDVCVVGSGAGGGTAAAVLAAAGLDVVVLEAGGYYDDADFDGGELAGYQRMYADGGGGATHDQSVGLLQGSCVGGGTVVNYTTSFRTPDDVREEWASHGASGFTSKDYDAAMDAVTERLGVNQEHSRPSPRDKAVQRGLAMLDWHSDTMPRNVRGCEETNCGWCLYGCRWGCKQSVAKTWLVDAQEAGARIVVGTRADRVIIQAGEARGVEARTASGDRVTVRSRAVVAACGSVNTPALLKRSGLRNPNVGLHLKLHPATAVWGVFEEEMRPWEGPIQALYSDEHRFLTGNYGLKYETAAVHPSLLIGFAPWRSARQHRGMLEAISHTVPVGVLLRDRDGGEVKVGRDGHPVVSYGLSEFDAAHVRRGLDGAAQILEAAGARRIFSSHTDWVGYEPGAAGQGRDRFLGDADACGWGAGRCTYYSFHLMGTARMGGSPVSSASNPHGETWDVRNLVVADASAFPTASGVNPMISIESTAHMNAAALAARLA